MTVAEILREMSKASARLEQLDVRLRKRIKAVLRAHGLRQADLARMTGRSEKCVSHSLNPRHTIHPDILGWATRQDSQRSPRPRPQAGDKGA